MDAKKISSTLSRMVGDEAVGAIEFQGFKWKVGNTTGSNIEYLYSLDDLIKNAHLFIKTLMADSTKKKIVVSLPAESYANSKNKEDGGLVKKFKDELAKNLPHLEDIQIMPQGVAAFEYLVNTKKIDPSIGNTLIIDGGFNTVNVSVINASGEILFTETIHDELGVYNLLVDFFRVELQAKYDGVSANAQILKKSFLEDKLDGGAVVVSIANEKQRAIQTFMAKLITRVMNDLKKKHVSFDQFLFVGGISYYVDTKVIETTKPFYIPKKDGEFLTVLGMKANKGNEYSAFDVGFGDTKYIL